MHTESHNEPNASDGAISAGKGALVEDLETVVADAGDLVKGVASAGAGEFAAVRTKLGTKLGEACTAVTDNARCAARATDGYAKEHPWTLLGVVAVTGFVVGTFFRRR